MELHHQATRSMSVPHTHPNLPSCFSTLLSGSYGLTSLDLHGLPEPGARKRARPGSEGGPAQQCAGPTRPEGKRPALSIRASSGCTDRTHRGRGCCGGRPYRAGLPQRWRGERSGPLGVVPQARPLGKRPMAVASDGIRTSRSRWRRSVASSSRTSATVTRRSRPTARSSSPARPSRKRLAGVGWCPLGL